MQSLQIKINIFVSTFLMFFRFQQKGHKCHYRLQQRKLCSTMFFHQSSFTKFSIPQVVICHIPEINKWKLDKSQIDSSRKSLQQPSKVTPNFVVNIFCHCDSIIDFLANFDFILQIYPRTS